MPGTASGEAAPGGAVAGDSHVEGFLTPRSQQGQGLPTIAEMVEGFPGAGLQLMSRVGDFFRVVRTEVMQVPVWQDSHATPPRSATRSLGSPGGASGQLALGDGSLGSNSTSGSPPQLGPQGTPTSFAPSHPGREGPLLNADMLQRMQALEQRAPLLYGNVPERPQSRTDSSSLPQEAIQAEVARQLTGFDQRAQAQDREIQRLRRQLEQEKAMREQLAREAAASSSAPQAPAPSQMQVRIPLQVPSSQDAQVHTYAQVQDVAAPAVGALRAPAQAAAAAAAASGFWSNFWSGLQGSHRLPSSATQVNLASSAPNPPSQAENLGLGQIWPQGSGMPQVPQVQGTQVPASPPGGVGPAAYAQVPQAQVHRCRLHRYQVPRPVQLQEEHLQQVQHRAQQLPQAIP